MKKAYNSLDLGKFIAALMVVAIHAHPFDKLGLVGEILCNVFLRLAVPFFFITSSFLFFKKEPQLEHLFHYVKRIMMLYFFWAIFSIPMFYIYHTPPYGDPISVGDLLFNFFMGSTYPGSWFLMASIESTMLVWILSQKFNNTVVFFICLCLYLFSLGMFDKLIIGIPMMELHRWQGNWAYASIYFILGKIIAEYGDRIRWKSHTWVVAVILMLGVDLFAYLKIFPLGNGIHLMLLVPLSFSIFLSALTCTKRTNLPYMAFRRMSILFYLSHFSFVAMVAFVLHHFVGVDLPLLRYVLVLICCLLLYLVMDRLSVKNGFKWLNYGF